MKRADIKLGYSCNNDCIHCVISDFRDIVFRKGLPEDIPAETYRKELIDSRSRAECIVFTGGEPTYRKEILDLVAFARELGFSITMQTNGRKLSQMDFAQALCAIAPINFCIALHGPNSAIHDKITRREKSFYETVQGIRNIIEIKKSSDTLSGKLVISKVNAPVLVDTVRFMISLGFRSINLTFPHACGNAMKDFFNVVPRYEDIKFQIIDAIELCLQEGVGVDTETIPLCFLPDLEFLAAELTMMMDEYTELKQYGSDQKIMDWTKVRREIKSKFPQCKECRFERVCEGPWMEYPERYGMDEFKPVPGEPVSSPFEIIEKSYLPKNQQSTAFGYSIDTSFISRKILLSSENPRRS